MLLARPSDNDPVIQTTTPLRRGPKRPMLKCCLDDDRGCRKSGTRRLGLHRARTAAAGSAVIAAGKAIRPSEQHVRAIRLARCPWAYGGARKKFDQAARRCTRTTPGLVYY